MPLSIHLLLLELPTAGIECRSNKRAATQGHKFCQEPSIKDVLKIFCIVESPLFTCGTDLQLGVGATQGATYLS